MKRQTPLKIEGCKGGHRSHLGFLQNPLEEQHLLPEHLLWWWVLSTSPVCVRPCQSPLPGPPVSSQEELCLFHAGVAPLQKPFPAAELCYPLLAGKTNQQMLVLPPLGNSRVFSHRGSPSQFSRCWSSGSASAGHLPSVFCVTVFRLGLDNRVVKSPVAVLHLCSIIIIPSKAAPAYDQR